VQQWPQRARCWRMLLLLLQLRLVGEACAQTSLSLDAAPV
jgi:hypothetical protein